MVTRLEQNWKARVSVADNRMCAYPVASSFIISDQKVLTRFIGIKRKHRLGSTHRSSLTIHLLAKLGRVRTVAG